MASGWNPQDFLNRAFPDSSPAYEGLRQPGDAARLPPAPDFALSAPSFLPASGYDPYLSSDHAIIDKWLEPPEDSAFSKFWEGVKATDNVLVDYVREKTIEFNQTHPYVLEAAAGATEAFSSGIGKLIPGNPFAAVDAIAQLAAYDLMLENPDNAREILQASRLGTLGALTEHVVPSFLTLHDLALMALGAMGGRFAMLAAGQGKAVTEALKAGRQLETLAQRAKFIKGLDAAQEVLGKSAYRAKLLNLADTAVSAYFGVDGAYRLQDALSKKDVDNWEVAGALAEIAIGMTSAAQGAINLKMVSQAEAVAREAPIFDRPLGLLPPALAKTRGRAPGPSVGPIQQPAVRTPLGLPSAERPALRPGASTRLLPQRTYPARGEQFSLDWHVPAEDLPISPGLPSPRSVHQGVQQMTRELAGRGVEVIGLPGGTMLRTADVDLPLAPPMLAEGEGVIASRAGGVIQRGVKSLNRGPGTTALPEPPPPQGEVVFPPGTPEGPFPVPDEAAPRLGQPASYVAELQSLVPESDVDLALDLLLREVSKGGAQNRPGLIRDKGGKVIGRVGSLSRLHAVVPGLREKLRNMRPSRIAQVLRSNRRGRSSQYQRIKLAVWELLAEQRQSLDRTLGPPETPGLPAASTTTRTLGDVRAETTQLGRQRYRERLAQEESTIRGLTLDELDGRLQEAQRLMGEAFDPIEKEGWRGVVSAIKGRIFEVSELGEVPTGPRPADQRLGGQRIINQQFDFPQRPGGEGGPIQRMGEEVGPPPSAPPFVREGPPSTRFTQPPRLEGPPRQPEIPFPGQEELPVLTPPRAPDLEGVSGRRPVQGELPTGRPKQQRVPFEDVDEALSTPYRAPDNIEEANRLADRAIDDIDGPC